MRSSRFSPTHPRLSPAHGSEPLTAPGAAQACPTCLPSPSHQLTFQDDLRLGCPLQNGSRFAPDHSTIGNVIGSGPAFCSLSMPVPARPPLICGVRDVWPRLRPLALAAIANPANQLTCESDFRPGRPLKQGARFAPSPPSIGNSTGNRPAFIHALAPNMAPNAFDRGHCSGRRALRVLGPSAIADAAIQPSFPESSGPIRPFVPSSLLPHTLLWPQRIGGFILSPSRGSHPLPTRDHCDQLPRSGEPDLPPSTPSPANKTTHAANNTRRTSASRLCLALVRTHGDLSRFGRSFSHSTPHQQSPRIDQEVYPSRIHRAETLLPETDSTRLAYQGATALLRPAFNRQATVFHPADAHPADQARCSEVIQDSDFRRKITIRKKVPFSSCPPRVRRGSGFDSSAIRLSLREFADFRSLHQHKSYANTKKNSRHAVPCGLHPRNEKPFQSSP